MKDHIVIIGGGGHSKVLISILKKNKNYIIEGYTDYENCGEILGIKYLGNDEILDELFNQGINYAALGLGQVNLTKKRHELANKIKNKGFKFPSIISPEAVVNYSVLIEEGVQVFDGVVVNSDTTIGDFTILNTNSTIEHDCKIGKYCHIATGATISGGVEIGDFTMMGANAVVIQYKLISDNCFVGAGGVVISDLKEGGTYVGNPVRKIR